MSLIRNIDYRFSASTLQTLPLTVTPSGQRKVSPQAIVTLTTSYLTYKRPIGTSQGCHFNWGVTLSGEVCMVWLLNLLQTWVNQVLLTNCKKIETVRPLKFSYEGNVSGQHKRAALRHRIYTPHLESEFLQAISLQWGSWISSAY